jgi:chaperonin GroES
MPKIKPLNDRVLIERVEASDKTSGGILLPDSAKEKPTEGRIVATGEGRRTDKGVRIPLSVTVGDRVLFGSYAGTTVKEGSQEFLILEESEILAVVDDAPFGAGRGSSGKGSSGKDAGKGKKSGRKKAGRG